MVGREWRSRLVTTTWPFASSIARTSLREQLAAQCHCDLLETGLTLALHTFLNRRMELVCRPSTTCPLAAVRHPLNQFPWASHHQWWLLLLHATGRHRWLAYPLACMRGVIRATNGQVNGLGGASKQRRDACAARRLAVSCDCERLYNRTVLSEQRQQKQIS